MPVYRYLALDAAGCKFRGKLRAGSPLALDQQLQRQSLDLIEARTETPPFWQRQQPSHTELMQLFMDLGLLSRAGIPLIDALADLRDTAEHPALRDSLDELVGAIHTGSPFSAALAQQPASFEPLLVNMVHTGEESGQLAEVLTHIGALLSQRATLAQQLKTVLLYPAMLALTIIAVVVFLMTYLVPQLTAFLLASGQPLPWQTRVLIGMSGLITRHWMMLTGGVLGFGLGIYLLLLRVSVLRTRLDHFKLNCWILGPLLKKIILARFAGGFAMMYRAGLSVFDCLEHLQPLMGNRILSGALAQIRRNIEGGMSLSESFRESGQFPALVTRMLHLGETTGGLDEALLNVSELYNRDIRAAIRRLQLMIEPAMTLVLGILLGWIMLAVLGPIYDLVAGSSLR